jgi:hypothetical protein
MPFNAPKASVFKQFAIRDSDGVVAALSAIDGGQIDEILTRSSDDQSGEAGGEVDARVAKGGGKRTRTRKVEEEIRRARTRHATAAKLLETLKEKESIGVVDGPFDMEVAEQVTAGMVLEFRAELRLHPLDQADAMLRSLIKVAPKFGEKQISNEMPLIMAMWGALIGSDQTDTRLLIEPYTSEPQVPRLRSPSAAGAQSTSLSRWAPRAIASITPSRRASSRPSSRSSSTAAPGRPGGAADRGLRVHRGLLQPPPAALDAGDPLARAVRKQSPPTD